MVSLGSTQGSFVQNYMCCRHFCNHIVYYFSVDHDESDEYLTEAMASVMGDFHAGKLKYSCSISPHFSSCRHASQSHYIIG